MKRAKMKLRPRNLDQTYCQNADCAFGDICARWQYHYDWDGIVTPVSFMDGVACMINNYVDMIEIAAFYTGKDK